MVLGNNFLGQTVSFGICQEVVFSNDGILKYIVLILQNNPGIWPICESSLHKFQLLIYVFASTQDLGFSTSRAMLGEKLSQMALVVFQGPDHFTFLSSRSIFLSLSNWISIIFVLCTLTRKSIGPVAIFGGKFRRFLAIFSKSI